MAKVFLGLGSNLGDGKANLDRAIGQLEQSVGRLLAVSSMIESEPWGYESEHRFTNAVAVFETAMLPMEVLDVTQAIERQMGRTHKHRPGEAYRDRIIDIDLLTYDEIEMKTDRLTLPHPHINNRDFVKNPMKECIEKLDNKK